MKVSPKLLGKTSKCVRCGAEIAITEANTSPLPDGDAPQPESKTAKSAVSLATGSQQRRIGELLLEDDLISQEQLNEALELQNQQGGGTFEILLSLGHLDKDTLHDFLSKQVGVASIDLKNYNIPNDVVTLITKEYAIGHLVLPIDKLGKLLTVAMACPLDTQTIEEVQHTTGLRVKPMLCRLDELHAAIEKNYPSDDAGGAAQVEQSDWGFALGGGAEQEAPEQEAAGAPPGDFEALGETVEKPQEAALSADAVRQAIARIEVVPALLATVQRIRKVVENAQSTLGDVIGIVEHDPPAVAKLLSLANARAFGMPGKADTIPVAAALLGYDGVCNIVVSSLANHEGPAADVSVAATNAVFCATAARAIASECDEDLIGVAYAAGLLHEIGRFALAQVDSKRYSSIAPGSVDGVLLAAEQGHYALDHCEAGAALLAAWRVPEAVVEAVRYHHDPDQTRGAAHLAGIVATAAIMAEIYQVQNSQDGDPLIMGKPLFEKLKQRLATLGLDSAKAAAISKSAANALLQLNA